MYERFTAMAMLLRLCLQGISFAKALSFWKGAEVPLKMPVGAIPFQVSKNLVQIIHSTTGWLEIQNTSPKTIVEVEILVRYAEYYSSDSVNVPYFGTTSSGKLDSSRWKTPLVPGGTAQIIGTSVWILKSCPTQGEVYFLKVTFSDGSRSVFGDPHKSADLAPSKLDIPRGGLGALPPWD